MENYVSAQLLLLGQAALLGMLGGVVYDLLRPLRRGRLIHLTDALFTGGGLVLMVWFLTAVSRGEARLFLLLGACGGAGLYFLLLAPLLRPLWDFWAAAAAAFGRLLALPLHFGVKLAEKNREFPEKTLSFLEKIRYNEKVSVGVSPICKAQERRPLWHGRKIQKNAGAVCWAHWCC